MLLGLLTWIYGGAQIGFYKTYYSVQRVDEITELEYQERVEAFLPGIETLVIAFAAFVVLLSASVILERRSENA
ncbi:hypothetical protein VDG1235_227 [Verrucomicrobiia bacterium DG1235]|nr:hypothetical protein VDG1235_227 [Verrucomicrobiae bacterium DG1235]